MKRPKVLGIAAASRHVGYVVLVGSELKDWKLSEQASHSTVTAADWTMHLLEKFRPDIIITEQLIPSTRKGEKTQENIEAITHVAAHADCRHIPQIRRQAYANKYDEAKALTERFPAIRDSLPKRRRSWQSERKNMIYFEALSLALAAINAKGASNRRR